MAEIDRDMAVRHRWFQRISLVNQANNVDPGISFRRLDDCLTHATGAANEQHTHGILHREFSKAVNVWRRRALFPSVISHNGKRHAADMTPRHSSTVFTGTGFGSRNK